MIESPEVFVRLRNSTDPTEYGRAATDWASVDTWLAIVRQYPEMRFWVAQNKSVPMDVLEILASDSDQRVRSMVASKGKLSSSILAKMAADESDEVRMRVARNRKTSREALEAMRDDPWTEIRVLVEQRLRS